MALFMYRLVGPPVCAELLRSHFVSMSNDLLDALINEVPEQPTIFQTTALCICPQLIASTFIEFIWFGGEGIETFFFFMLRGLPMYVVQALPFIPS